MSQNAALALPLPSQRSSESAWLLSRRWDLVFLIGGALLVPLPLLIKNGFGLSVSAVNLAITVLIGGPHLFATFSYTLLEKRFWKLHPYYAMGAFAIPPLVVYLGLNHFPVLIGVFFFWASIHILHQMCFLVDCYQAKRKTATAWARLIDYGVVFTSIYPIAIYKMVNGTFTVAGQTLKLPFVLGNHFVFVAMTSLFAAALALYLGKCVWEIREKTLNGPKTLLILVTVVVSFLIPIPKDLDVTFQGFNTWHSLQYIGLAWWINVLRKERAEISSPLVNKIAGRSRTPYFYAACLVPTLIFLGIIAILVRTTSLPSNQCYFMVVLSGLLAHYYFDHWVFTKTQAVVP
ncbi:MAG TPA: hypothetical protein VFX30_10640 [bacterium]|nr:hypothetical protein [bacterium]